MVGEGEVPAGVSWAALATWAGLALIWVAAVLTFWTGWDYFMKAMPLLKDRPK